MAKQPRKNSSQRKRNLPPKNDDDNDDESVDSTESELSSPRPMKRKPRKTLLRGLELFKKLKSTFFDIYSRVLISIDIKI